MISVRVDTGIKLVQEIGAVRAGAGRAMSGTDPMSGVRAAHSGVWVAAMVPIGIHERISLVADVGGVRTGIVRGD